MIIRAARCLIGLGLLFPGLAGLAQTSVTIFEYSPAPGGKVPARPNLYGHNMAGVDWHGTIDTGVKKGRAPSIWDVAGNRPDPVWTSLISAYPLRVVRFHTGNHYAWRNAVGRRENRRPVPPAEHWSRPYNPEAGLDEFFRWIEAQPVPPEVSLIASPLLPAQEVADLVAYCNATSGPMARMRGANGHSAPYRVRYWELGNETDWANRKDLDVLRNESAEEKAGKLKPEEYVALCRKVIAAIRKADPDARILSHAQTAPWTISNPQWRAWHREVLREIGGELDGVVIHPYYDGYSVPYVLGSVDALIADIRQLKPLNRFGRPVTVVINEHARWIDPSNREKWQLSWSLHGAVSTGDFLLRAMARPEISAANYWCYIHKGPWRVLDRDWANPDSAPFGTAIHHLYKVLNDTLGSRYELLSPEPATSDTGQNYAYQVTAGLFSDPATGARSLVAVNRSADQSALILLKDLPAPKAEGSRRLLITAETLDSSNVVQSPDAVKLAETQAALVRNEQGALQFELPAKSVAAWSWR